MPTICLFQRGKRHKIMLTHFSLNLLSQASSGHSNLPRNPTPILMNMSITFQDDDFLTSPRASHTLYPVPPQPHLFTTNSVSLPVPALYPCLISCYHGIRVLPPIKAQPLHLCCIFQPSSSFEELCFYSRSLSLLHQFSSTGSLQNSNEYAQ